MLNKDIKRYVEQTIDDALICMFDEAKKNEFSAKECRRVYACIYKNKLAILLSKEKHTNNFDLCLEIRCPLICQKSKNEHISDMLNLLSKSEKFRMNEVFKKFEFESKQNALNWMYFFMTRNFALKMQKYFDNYITSFLNEVHHCTEYKRLVEILTRKLQLSDKYCDEFEVCNLIGDIIRSSDLNLSFDEVSSIVDQIYSSNVLQGVRIK